MPAPHQQLSELVVVAWNWAAVFLPRAAAGIGVFIVGITVAGWVARVVRNLLLRAPHVDPALKPLISNIVRYGIVGLTIVATLGQFGFETSSLLAVLGAAGLAIGLALQGTLSNIAAGIMLLWLRPFQIGDYIEVAGQGGAVEEIGLFGCKLRTFDGIFLFLPNSTIWNAPLKNHTRNGGRLVSVDITLPASVDADAARELLMKLAKEMPDIEKHPKSRVFVTNLTASGLLLTFTLWAKPQCAGTVERSIVERIKSALDARGEAWKPVQILRTVPPDADPSRFLEGHEPLPLHFSAF